MAIALADSLSFTGTGTNTSVHLNMVANGQASFVSIAVNQSAIGQIASVTDSAGNNYVKAGSYAGSLIETELWYALNCTLNNTVTVTVTPASGLYVWAAVWAVFSGIAATLSYDQTEGSASALATSLDTGNTPTTQSANELVLGCFGQANNRPFSSGSGFTGVTSGSNGTTAQAYVEYKVVSSTGNYNATTTIDIASNLVGGVFTFSDTPIGGGGGPSTFRLGLLGVG